MKYSLTLEQIDFWERHHYLTLNDFFDVSQKRDLLEWADEIASLPENPVKWMQTYEFDGFHVPKLSLIEHFLEEHNAINALVQGARTNVLLSTLMEEKVTIFNENLRIWYPNSKGLPAHQAASDLNTVGPSHHIVMMIALDKGILHLPRHFKYHQKVATHKEGSLSQRQAAKLSWDTIECYTGDMILIDSYLPYAIPQNESDLIRRAFIFSYNKVSDGGSKRDAYYEAKFDKIPKEKPNKDKKSYA